MQQQNSHQVNLSAPEGTAESLASKSIAELAGLACAMPWEDKAPFSVRYAFEEAVTPELFVELLEALQVAVSYLAPRVLGTGGDGDKRVLPILTAAIAKATAAVTNPIEADPK